MLRDTAVFVCFVCFAFLVWYCEGCAFPSRPLYNSRNNDYVSCDPAGMECPTGYVCFPLYQSKSWRDSDNPELLHLCCSDVPPLKQYKTGDEQFQPVPFEPTVTTTTSAPSQLFTTQPTTTTTTVLSTTPVWVTSTRTQPAPPKPLPAPAPPTQLSALPNPIDQQTASQPLVTQLLNGKIGSLALGELTGFRKTGTVTLIQDGALNILVDTGFPIQKTALMEALSQQNLTPEMVHVVVISHGHPDHYSNLGLFTASQVIWEDYFSKADEIISNGLNKQILSISITPNVQLLRTPGHTEFDNTVLVRNVPILGTIAITGGLFMNVNDFQNADQWRSVAWNMTAQEQSRAHILCTSGVNYIIPGHGTMFLITQEMRTSVPCMYH